MPDMPPGQPPTLTELVHRCAPQVHPHTLTKIVLTESGANPYAIGVVGGRLVRQPRNRMEAIATVQWLKQQGRNFSAGLGQINVGNWARLGLDERSVFDPCANLGAAQAVLRDCFDRAPGLRHSPQQALRQAFSCYYSGNFSTGFEHGYVARVVAAEWLQNRPQNGPQNGPHPGRADVPRQRRAGPDG